MEASLQTISVEKLFENQQKKSLQLRNMPLAARYRALKSMKQWIDKNQNLIIEEIRKDYKKPAEEILLTEIMVVTAEIRHALSHLYQWASPKKAASTLTMLGTTAKVIYEPKGVCLIIAPWNFPFNLALGPLVSALAAGNTVILKPSEMTPKTSALIKRMVEELFESNHVAVVEGGIPETQELLKLPFNHIFFTGSPAVGKIVMQAAAKHLTSVTLELGGKSPVIVTESANIKDTVQKITWGKWLNNGQTCIAPDYILVHHAIKDKFTAALTKEIQSQFGKEENQAENKDYGRLVNQKHFQRMQMLLEDALQSGSKMLFGGKHDEKEAYFQPVVLEENAEDSLIMQEEIFGPILPIKTFEQLEETVAYINARPKPLALYVFSTKKGEWQYLMEKTSSGSIVINDVVLQFTHNNLPFGGVNNSGIGKSHGWYGFEAFSNQRAFLKQRIGFTSLKNFYPPYNGFKRKIMGIVKKLLY